MPVNRAPRGTALAQHIVVALAVAFGLSLLFWLLQGVFVPAGFILWSLFAAAVGVSVGAFLVRNIVWTGVVTAVVRVLVYAVIMRL